VTVQPAVGETCSFRPHPTDVLNDNFAEWIEADGLGGFASGTICGVRTRRYHGLLLAATTPPTGRMMLVNGVEAWAVTPHGRFALSSHLYQPGVRHPDGASRLVAFAYRPWPTWTWDLGEDCRIVGEVLATSGAPRVVMTWRLESGPGPVTIELRPLMSGRGYHSLHHENGAFRFDPERREATLIWRPYDGLPPVTCHTNGAYSHQPEWFRQFLYLVERERGLDDTEDLASPGVITCVVDREEAICAWQAGEPSGDVLDAAALARRVRDWRAAERRRRSRFETPIALSADLYLVRRGHGRTIVAGYPWFTDWGRDTFIALRGLCLTQGRLTDARDILLEWSGTVSEGMLPNRFPDAGGLPEYNAVDASLWFIVAAHELMQAAAGRSRTVTRAQQKRLQDAVIAILEGYVRGTRYGIHMDSDGLIAAGEKGEQLTWMDARVGDREITPRIGKPVEIQALWLNALHAAAIFDSRWRDLFVRGALTFGERFWNAERGALFDVVDVDHRSGVSDGTLRPNQILAVGGLPVPIIADVRARSVVDVVEQELWTPIGLRSLGRDEPGYTPLYAGDGATRDAAYHQGTVWPWLIGPFVDAWLRVRGYTGDARASARERFVAPLERHLDESGLGHVSEIADAEPPFTPRGCPFQAWSLGELIRLQAMVSLERPSRMPPPAAYGASSVAQLQGSRE
jgi:predicted glycogen debranching enzyme